MRNVGVVSCLPYKKKNRAKLSKFNKRSQSHVNGSLRERFLGEQAVIVTHAPTLAAATNLLPWSNINGARSYYINKTTEWRWRRQRAFPTEGKVCWLQPALPHHILLDPLNRRTHNWPHSLCNQSQRALLHTANGDARAPIDTTLSTQTTGSSTTGQNHFKRLNEKKRGARTDERLERKS